MSNENGKKLFKSIYDENPAQFKQDFTAGIKQKVMDKINAKREEIVDSINKPTEVPEEEEENTED
jgi:hypothetical protein